MAGVLEDGKIKYPDTGTPQGGVISPLLANIYLHEVLDVWFERDVRPRLSGRAMLIRHADDCVLVFERVRLPWFGAVYTSSLYGKRYEAGRYDLGRCTLYVSRGIGMEGAPRVRFLCPPELVLWEIEGAR